VGGEKRNGIFNNLNWRRIAIRGALIVIVFGLLVYLFVFSKYGYLRMRDLQRENGELEGRVAEVERKNEELETEIGRLEDDMEAVERLAREELGLVKEGETVYRFIEVEGRNNELLRMLARLVGPITNRAYIFVTIIAAELRKLCCIVFVPYKYRFNTAFTPGYRSDRRYNRDWCSGKSVRRLRLYVPLLRDNHISGILPRP